MNKPRINLIGQTSGILSLLPLVVVVAILIIVAIHPRNNSTSNQEGRRFLEEGVGYKGAVDSLAALDVFEVRTLPDVQGLRPRSAITFDEAALKRAAKGNAICNGSEEPGLGKMIGFLKGSFDRQMAGKSDCEVLLADYRKATFLNQDMVRASDDIWKISEDRVTGIRSRSHSLRLSGFDPNSSDFKVFYNRSGKIGRVSWTFVDPTSLNTFRATSKSIDDRCSSSAVPEEFPMYCFEGGVILEVPPRSVGVRLYKNGRQYEVSNAHGNPKIVSLTAGDTIAFGVEGTTPLRAVQLLKQREAVSGIYAGERVRDPHFSELVSQIDTRLARDISSSIDPKLQSVLQKELEQALDGAPRNVGSSLRGSIMLMDGMTGSIAASATFPSKPKHLFSGDSDRPSREIWLQQNHGFSSLPVGSTAKVPFAFAIAAAHPELLGLELGRSPKAISYDPIKFLKTGSFAESRKNGRGAVRLIGSGRANVDFETAIEASDNLFAIKLIRDAWAANLERPREAEWLHNIHLLTCATPKDSDQKKACPIYLWGDQHSRTRGLPHKSVSFAFDPKKVARAPHNELFYGPLGNGSYNWSLAQLTQSYARLLSGNLVTASMTSKGHTGPSLSLYLRGEGYQQSWAAVVRGMNDVISTGTAKELNSLHLGDGVIFYAKTGTPTTRYRKGANGKVLVLAAIKTKSGRPLKQLSDQRSICSIRLLSINMQYDTSPFVVVSKLLGHNGNRGYPELRKWMVGKC